MSQGRVSPKTAGASKNGLGASGTVAVGNPSTRHFAWFSEFGVLQGSAPIAEGVPQLIRLLPPTDGAGLIRLIRNATAKLADRQMPSDVRREVARRAFASLACAQEDWQLEPDEMCKFFVESRPFLGLSEGLRIPRWSGDVAAAIEAGNADVLNQLFAQHLSTIKSAGQLGAIAHSLVRAQLKSGADAIGLGECLEVICLYLTDADDLVRALGLPREASPALGERDHQCFRVWCEAIAYSPRLSVAQKEDLLRGNRFQRVPNDPVDARGYRNALAISAAVLLGGLRALLVGNGSDVRGLRWVEARRIARSYLNGLDVNNLARDLLAVNISPQTRSIATHALLSAETAGLCDAGWSVKRLNPAREHDISADSLESLDSQPSPGESKCAPSCAIS